MAVAIQSLSCARFATVGGGTRSFPLQRKPLLFSVTLSSRSQNLYSSIVTASSKKRNKKKKSSHFTASSKNNNNINKEKTSHVTKGNDKEEDAFEMLFKQFEVLKTDDLSKDVSGDDRVTDEEIALFEHELEGMLGELEGMLGGFEAESLNSDTGETQTDNDAEKNSGDRNENSLFEPELEGVLGEFDAKLLNSDTGKTQADNDAEKNSGDGNENSLFVRELEGMLGELEGVLGEFDTELLNSDARETQVVNDAKKCSSDGNENSPKLRTSKLNKLVRALKTRRHKTSKDLSHVTEGNDKEEDAFEMLLKKLEEALKTDDLSKDGSGDDDITKEEITLFERKVEDLLVDFDVGLLNSDSSETQADDNDDEKNSGDGYDNSMKLRTWISSISFSLFGECF